MKKLLLPILLGACLVSGSALAANANTAQMTFAAPGSCDISLTGTTNAAGTAVAIGTTVDPVANETYTMAYSVVNYFSAAVDLAATAGAGTAAGLSAGVHYNLADTAGTTAQGSGNDSVTLQIINATANPGWLALNEDDYTIDVTATCS